MTVPTPYAALQLLEQLGLDPATALPVVEWHSWLPQVLAKRTTIQLLANDHVDNLALTFTLPDGSSYPVPGVNTPGAGPVVEFGYFDLEALGLSFTNNSIGVSATYPNTAYFQRTPISGTDADGVWTGYQFNIEDRGGSGDGDFNDIVMAVKSYPDLVDPTPASTTSTTWEWRRDLDRSRALAAYQVVTGRSSAYVNTDPTTASVALLRQLMGAQLPQVGERFRLTLNPTLATALGIVEDDRPRFTGEVTDPVVDTEGVLTLTATGRRARLSRVTLELPLPQQTTGARVARVLELAQQQLTSLEVDLVEPGGPELLKVTDPADAQTLIESAATASTGQLVEHRDGRLAWHGVDHRRARTPRVALDGAVHLLKPFSWQQHAATVVNEARVTWGGEAGGVVTVTDPSSADLETGLGPFGVDVGTDLAAADDAQALGSLLVGRRAEPRWELPTVTADLVRSAADRAGVLLTLEHGDKVDVTTLPADGPWVSSALFVEGCTETFNPRSWQLSLALSDPAVSGVALRWVDVPAALSWAQVAPTLTWLDVAALAEDDTPALGTPLLDGGTAATASFDDVLDAGTASTSSWSSTIDGGTTTP